MNEQEKEIELYLSGNMTPEERLNFEKKMNSDPRLKQDVTTYQQMQSFYDQQDWNTADPKIQQTQVDTYEAFLKSKKGKDIASGIKKAENQYFLENTNAGIKKWILYGSAIAAILIIGFFIVLHLNTKTNPSQLYAAYKNWEELPSLTLRDQNTKLSEAEKLFREERYSDALTIFKNYQEVYPDDLNPQVLLYIGISELELNQNEKAEKTFAQLLHSNTLDAPKAHWYLALTYLKVNEPDKAKQELNKILANPKNFNYQKAQELASELE